MRRTLLASAIGVAMLAASSLTTATATEWVVEAHYPDVQALARAAAHFQHVRVDREREVLRVATDEAGMELLRSAGLAVGIDHAASARLHSARQKVDVARRSGVVERGPTGYPGIPGFQCYRTVEGTDQTMDDLAATHPAIVEAHPIGPSWKKTQNPSEGYEMRALRITNLATATADPERPTMVAFSSIHAREYAPAELMTRFAEWLVSGYGIDPEATWLVDHNDFRLVLQANPDGRKHAEGGDLWRKNANDVDGYCSWGTHGIDLNRNFPFHWDITNGDGSSGNVCDETFRGPQARSEPETENLVDYVAGSCNAAGECSGGVFADRRTGSMIPAGGSDDGGAAPDDTRGIFFDMHSAASLVLWSWGDTPGPAPNQAGLRTLGRRFAFFNNYYPQQSDELYATDGTTDDTMYGLLGVPSYTFELDDEFGFFQDCGSFEGITLPKNLAALRYAARALHAPYRLPSGPDTLAVTVSGPDLIAIGDTIDVSAQLDSGRFNQSNGNEPVHNIAGASLYLDQLPWDAGAAPIALSAADGAFNSTIETATTALSTAGWPQGRHFLHVQGVAHTTAQAGTPNAAFVDVAAADDIATLQGHVTDHASGDPLAATLTLVNEATGEVRSTQSNAADGAYARTMLEGNVAVRVSAPDHLAEEIPALALVGGESTLRDFALLPNCTVFEDDAESGASAWVAQSPWAIVTNVTGNVTHAWTTGSYSNNLDSSLTSASAIDLSGYDDIMLAFDDRCATENGYDYGYAEYSTNGGGSWNTLYACDGRPSWQSHEIPLPSDANGSAAFKLRFRLSSDTSQNGAGWSIDNIRLEAGGDSCRAQQEPDDTIFADGFDGS